MSISVGQLFFTSWGQMLFLAACATFLPALGSWLVQRLTKPVDKYTEAIADQVARKQNLPALVREVKQLTETTELIKNQFSHESWSKQQRWTRRHEEYTIPSELITQYLHAASEMTTRVDIAAIARTPEQIPAFDRERQRVESFLNASVKLQARIAIAGIFIGQRPYSVIAKIFQGCPWNEVDHDVWKQYFQSCVARSLLFSESARADLGYEEIKLSELP